MSSFRNKLAEALSAPLIGVVNLIPSAVTTQAIAAAGADFVMIDQEHGPIGPENLHAMIAATQGTACSPLVRVSRPDEGLVKTALDCGAEGIVFPYIESAADAARCVAMTRYPPLGRRGWGPYLAHSRWGVALEEHVSARGAETVCILLIETSAAIDQIESIVAVEGIDALIIATADLAMSLGVDRQDSPRLLAAVAQAERAILDAGLALGGGAASRAQSEAAAATGYRMLFRGIDIMMLEDAVEAVIARAPA
jgi:4-hydroxy-2-oxoheptanedioate aldolase